MAVVRWSDINGPSAMKTAIDAAGAAGQMLVCSGATQPVTRAEAIAAGLATKNSPTLTLTGAAGSDEVCTISEELAVPVDVSGTATSIALIDASKLWFVTTCTSQALVDTGTVDIPAWVITVKQPTAP